jgi:hypothetical protein
VRPASDDVPLFQNQHPAAGMGKKRSGAHSGITRANDNCVGHKDLRQKNMFILTSFHARRKNGDESVAKNTINVS